MEETCGGSRRRFLKTAAVASGGAAALSVTQPLPVLGQEPSQKAPETKVPQVTLGKTGQKVTKLGMGTSWKVDPSFVQRALFAGVRYIDTSETYERGQSEKTIGQVLQRTGMRKDVFLVTKNNFYSRAQGDAKAKSFESHLESSLERLQTDYVDAYYMHGMSGRDLAIFEDAGVKAVFAKLKKAGKIRFAGFSCHDPQIVEIIEAAAKAGWIDQMMIQYNFREMDNDTLKAAIDAASKANIGIVAMKTQGGSKEFRVGEKIPRINDLLDKGLKVPQAALKSVWNDERIHAIVSEMTNTDELKMNMAASLDGLTPKEARLLQEHKEQTAGLYCHGCGHLCGTASKGVPVETVLRYYRYYQGYGKREEARALYQAMPGISRAIADADLAGLDAACPHGLPVVDLLRDADRHLA